MSKKIIIKYNSKENCYYVQSITINKNGESVYIPSPYGTESMFFSSLEEAKIAIENLGFEYIIDEVHPIIASEKQEVVEQSDIDYDKIIDVFIKNLGHENIEIRTSAINSLSKFGLKISEKLIKSLENENWLIQQSVIKCIEQIIARDSVGAAVFTDILIKVSDSENTMVKSAALKALEKVCETGL